LKAILSVHDKTGLVDFAAGLRELGFEIYSTGGTRKALQEAGVEVSAISELTGFPEIMDGRVKTLHPGVHAGILADRSRPRHMDQLAKHGLAAIDLVAVNLYPFQATSARPGVSVDEVIEDIDIGGLAMIRAAAKNHASVLVVVDPSDYDRVLMGLRDGEVPVALRRQLAAEAFAHTAAYDSAIAAYTRQLDPAEGWPRDYSLAGAKVQEMRYGENPHQAAALYRTGAGGVGVAAAEQLQGIELSYNNTVDVDAAWDLVQDLPQPAAAIIKHANPCGVAVAPNLSESYQHAYESDPTSAYGGIVALNQECDVDTARQVSATFLEVVAAPSFSPAALEVLSAKKKLRVLRIRPAAATETVKVVSGGFLVQSPDAGVDDPADMRSVGRRQPTEAQWEQLLLAWRVVKHVRSNAIVLVRDGAAVGIGAGQMSRVESVNLAVQRAGDRAAGSVLASDAFFPMVDGVEVAADAGVTAIIQPGGSIRDEEVLEVANERGLAMVYTGRRHFRH
jgi:phosphoribosylaminoimidazolecarboxamide formyltransferase / IMP cyclohydrolase